MNNQNCTACEAHREARVSDTCPDHRYCTCNYGVFEKVDGVYICSECELPNDGDIPHTNDGNSEIL